MYELGNYYVLTRVLYMAPYHSPVHPGRVLSTFAGISVIIEALNGNGATYSANRDKSQQIQDTGTALLKAALVLQLFVVVLFILITVWFHTRCRRHGINNTKINNTLTTLYMSSALLTVRTIYRTVEYFDSSRADFIRGDDANALARLSPMVRYEWFFYVFEASLMLANAILLSARHPRRWLPASNKVYLTRDGNEVTGPGYDERRSLFVALFDIFDIRGLLKGKDRATRFWDVDHDDDSAVLTDRSEERPRPGPRQVGSSAA